MSEARKHIAKMIGDAKTWPLITGTVKHVDAETCDVDPSDGGPTMHLVRLKPAIESDDLGLIVYPKVGSACIVGELDGNTNNLFLVSAASIERILIELDGGAKLELKPGGIMELNGADYGGLVKWPQLQEQLAKLTSFMNAVQQAFNAWAPTSGDSGVAQLKAASSGFTSLPKPQYDQVQSSKTKHGSA